MIQKLLLSALCLTAVLCLTTDGEKPFTVAPGLFDPADTLALGLPSLEGAETITVFSPADETDHFSNGVVMTAFQGTLYCMWQSSHADEDAPDTWVAYSRSTDGGRTWTKPMVLCPADSSACYTSGGWLVSGEQLVAYVNKWPAGQQPKGGEACFLSSSDGLTWTAPAPVLMADGRPMRGIIEQDPHVLGSGRIVCAAHVPPGLQAYPVYTDDSTGVSGWRQGHFSPTPCGDQSAELEPSLFQQKDGTLVMVFRDQRGSHRVLAATSRDNGETWTKAVATDMPDSRAKQSAGNLPDGTPFMVNNPITRSKPRTPLVLTLSTDGGYCFNRSYLLRSGADLPPRRYQGKAKTLGYSYPKSFVADGWLYVAYSVNKETVQFTRVPIVRCGMTLNGTSPKTKRHFSD